MCGAAFCVAFVTGPAAVRGDDQAPILMDQGQNWTVGARLDFYGQDQGSRIMPLSWLKALKQADGQPFLADSLGRYGYLYNPDNADGLPVGFAATGLKGNQFVGMSCAACHTRQILVEGKNYRIDGGPAIADFQTFLADLDTATGKVLADAPAFADFADAALGQSAQPRDRAVLRDTLTAWRLRYHALMSGALPDPPWGYGRLDAVSMIFNRLTGLDLGQPPSHLIAANIRRADAPVRYPFLWNASIQDKTQWPGFADNGSDSLALSRNLGEVFGVFGEFEPTKKIVGGFFGVDYLGGNSANFDGLDKLEKLIARIGPPKWPWPVDQALADKGAGVFEQNCKECHWAQPGQVQFPNEATWKTPLKDVGTDTREYGVATRKAQSGVLQGRQIPLFVKPLNKNAYAIDILAVSVLGSILQHTLSPTAIVQAVKNSRVPPSLDGLKGAFRSVQDIKNLSADIASSNPVYEARVLQGVWAAAPYLHNGSVATLSDLLKPASERAASFKTGPAYDTQNIGLAADQPAASSTLQTTGCDDRNSGDSRCGHEYGAQLPVDDKKALLEYLKTL